MGWGVRFTGEREFRGRVREVRDAVTARAMANDTVRAVVANQRLEGLEPTAGEVAVLLDIAEGRVSAEDALAAASREIRADAVVAAGAPAPDAVVAGVSAAGG